MGKPFFCKQGHILDLFLAAFISSAQSVAVDISDTGKQKLLVTAGGDVLPRPAASESSKRLHAESEQSAALVMRQETKVASTGFTKIGAGICRLNNCTCFPWWRSSAGNRTDAQEECRLLTSCIAYAVDRTTEERTVYHLFFNEDGTDERTRSDCMAKDVNKGDACVPQFDCYKKDYSAAALRRLQYILALLVFGMLDYVT
mmetsp:Transcript_86734/g.136841  ORF Transcript_86734/g.136841 Transcript_86734/m.136841 type:complete len:201 (-) Transcript_86734:101-703(-)